MELVTLSESINLGKHTETQVESDDAEIEREGQLDGNELMLLRGKLHHLHQLLNRDNYTPEICDQIRDGFEYFERIHCDTLRIYYDTLPNGYQAYYLFLKGLEDVRRPFPSTQADQTTVRV